MANILARTRTIIGSTADWAANNIVVGDGELAAERLVSGKVKLKCGNGLSTFSALPYIEADMGAGKTVDNIPYATSVTPDMANHDSFAITLTGPVLFSNPTGAVAGQSGAITITQDGTGTRVATFGSAWKFEGGTAPTLSTAANSVDVLTYYVVSGSFIVARLIADNK